MGAGRQIGTAMEFDVLTGALGAEVSGLNLNKPLSGAEMDAVHQGLTQHQVLFFRDQRLTPESHWRWLLRWAISTLDTRFIRMSRAFRVSSN